MRLKDKVAVVTGGGSGIGKATATLFAREGARVLVVDLDGEAARETAADILRSGGEALAATVDVSRAADAERMVATAVARYGRLDVLFNNAGIDIPAPLHETSEELWDKTLAVNLKGVYLGCRYAVPVMLGQGRGSIVNTASVLAQVGSPNQAAYCASKGGVVALTRQMAVDYARRGIRVNAVLPGDVSTPLQERFLAKVPDRAATLAALVERHPIGRFAQAEEIAAAVLFLASDEASFITGAVLPVDGGFTSL